MSYSFRIRFKISKYLRIGINSKKLLITPENTIPEIFLCSTQEEIISSAEDLVFISNGYASAQEAKTKGELFRDNISKAFSKLRIPADFGDRAPKSFITNYGLQMIENMTNERVLNNELGLMIYKTYPKPRFAGVKADAISTTKDQRFIQTINKAIKNNQNMIPEEQLSFDLFSASFFQDSVDSQFLMLMMAIETLIKTDRRSKEATKLVDEFIDNTMSCKSLSKPERDSLLGSLKWLLYESISQSGRKLAEKLGTRIYNNMDPQKFFTSCYELRSKLVHGSVPRPSREEIASASLYLINFVGDLLSGHLLD
jgi:hypothetical protein